MGGSVSVVMSPSSWKPRDNFISSRPAADASHSAKALSASYPALNVGYKSDLFLRVGSTERIRAEFCPASYPL